MSFYLLLLRNSFENKKMSLFARHLPALAGRLYRLPSCNQYRYKSYDPDGKMTVTILNNEVEIGLMIDSFSQLGFRLNNGMAVLGPMAIFPRSILSWNVSGLSDVNEESLSLFTILEPKLDILVLGVGEHTKDLKMSREIIMYMKKFRINVEVLPTEQACATFNFLNAEGRHIAGALIPPDNLRHTDDDVILSKMRYNKLYGSDDTKSLTD